MGRIHAAQIDKSPRLQRLHKYLSDGKEKTTLQIILEADICAVNSAVAELRENGFDIICRKAKGNSYTYRMEVCNG